MVLLTSLACLAALAGCGGSSSNSPAPPAGSPAISFAPASLTFGTLAVGMTSAPQSVTATNGGNAVTTISSVTASGDFVLTANTCGSSLAAGASCTLTTTFVPTAAGARTGAISLATNVGGSPQTVALSGTGAGSQATLAPSSLAFGAAAIGFPTPPQTIVVTNTGTATTTINSASVTGDYALTGNTCGTSLVAGASCTLTVVFTPTVAGARTGVLSLATNVIGSPETAALSGTGGTPQAALSPASLAFGAVTIGGTSADQMATLTNAGTGALTIASVKFTGDFSLDPVNTTCASPLAAGANCQYALAFTASTSGTRTGTFTLIDNAAGSPQTIALSGQGGTPVLTFSAASLSFGSINLGSMSAVQTILVSSGNAALNVAAATVSGDFTVTSDTCPATLPQNTVCSVSVLFKPTAAGARTGSLSLANNLAGAPQAIPLSGTGVVPVSQAGLTFQATVKAGTQSIAGATVQLFAAGTTANGSASLPLLAAALTTNTSGAVTIPAGYVCPTTGSQLYLMATGGTVGSASAPNPNIRLLTAIGACGGIATGSSYTVDEVTTVASAYALTQFYAGGTAIGATGSNALGLANAFATAATLADPALGRSPGPTLPSNAVSPASRVNTVANILYACTASATACPALYAATTAGTSIPNNTFDAAINLARHPATNIAALYTQSLVSPVYAPALSASPADWTMFVNYAGGGMNGPSGIGIDSAGVVYVANYFYVASAFSPQGAAFFPNGITGFSLNNSYGLAVDLNDNIWIPNQLPFTGVGIGTVTSLAVRGASVPGSAIFQNGGLNYPSAVAIDPNGTVWVDDYGNSHLTLLDLQGNPLSGPNGYTTPLFAFPIAIAIDSNHYGWIANQSSTTVTKVAPDGSSASNFNQCCTGASGIALDQSDNVWVANFYSDSVSLISNTGALTGAGTYTGFNGLSRPQGIAIDGAGNAWVASYRQPFLTELAGANAAVPGTSLTPATGFGADAKLLEAYALAIDASGNIWVTNFGSNTVTKFIGIAVPVKTPLSALPKAP